MGALLERTDRGLYCAAGGFYVDPWEPVERAVVTHAHADHACPGCRSYLTTSAGEALLRSRVGPDAAIEPADYGAVVRRNGVSISLHPSGHILGSGQARLESGGEIWVVSGDYKLAPDPTCAPFEPVRCHTFITESTFGLPIYRWPPGAAVLGEIQSWWRANQEAGRASVLFAYALGKAQRVLAGLDPSLGPIFTHGAVESSTAIYRAAGVQLVRTQYAGAQPDGPWSRALILAPPSAVGSPWLRRFGDLSTGFVSGWMRIRGTRRRRSLDRGFVISDHADWPELLQAIQATGATQVWVTHGYRAPLARWLAWQGLDAHSVATRFEGEQDDAGADSPPEGAE